MLPGYNTNGFAHHRLEDALTILAEQGYRSVALTVDYHALDPYRRDREQFLRVGELLDKHRLACVIETGARFLLDPRRKHQPTLLSAAAEERAERLEFLFRCIDLAGTTATPCVSFWSGAAEERRPDAVLWDRLVAGCRELCAYAQGSNVRLAFEPEPGMFIDSMANYERLFDAVAHPLFGLTLDVGHLHCQGELPVAPHIERWRDVLWNVHIEDMRAGVHEHLFFGEGELDFPPILAALRSVGYRGGLHVELSRHSHDAVRTAQRARAFLAELGVT